MGSHNIWLHDVYNRTDIAAAGNDSALAGYGISSSLTDKSPLY